MIFDLFLHVRRVFKNGLKLAYDGSNSAPQSIGFLQSDGSEPKLSLTAEGITVDGEVVVPAIQGVQRAEVSVSSAELLALNATPKVIIPAPGVGKYIIVQEAVIRHEGAGQTAYAAGGACELRYTNGAGSALTPSLAVAGFWDQTTDETRFVRGEQGDAAWFTPTENAPVVLNMQTADLTTGTGTAEVIVWYRVVDADNIA